MVVARDWGEKGIGSYCFCVCVFILFYLFVHERQIEAETQAEGETGSMHQEPDVGFDLGSPGSHPGPKAGAKPLHHPGIPILYVLEIILT